MITWGQIIAVMGMITACIIAVVTCDTLIILEIKKFRKAILKLLRILNRKVKRK